MHLGADRIDVLEGERLHGVLVVHPPEVAVIAAGGLAHLGHELEDVGFRDVRMWESRPLLWSRGGEVPTPSDLQWLLWFAATPIRTASFARDLTEDFTVAQAWTAAGEREPEGDPTPGEVSVLLPPHPYAVRWHAPGRIAGIVRAFGVAYFVGLEVRPTP